MADLLNVPSDVLPTFLQFSKPQIRLNSQGEPLETTDAPLEQLREEELAAPEAELDLSLGDTALAEPIDGLCAPTDDSQLEHKIISCGHVLKSTHDFARWSEKTGAHRVNDFESLSCIDDLAVGEQRQAPLLESSLEQDIGNLFGGEANQLDFVQDQGWTEEQQGASEVIHTWPVLKSTHDAALWSEKRGSHSVNHEQISAGVLDEIAVNDQRQSKRPRSWGPRQRPQRQWQAKEQAAPQTGIQGSSLQSGLDTEIRSHVQIDPEVRVVEKLDDDIMA